MNEPKTTEKKQTHCDMLIDRLENKFVPKGVLDTFVTTPGSFEQRMRKLEEENARLKKEFETALNTIMEEQKKVILGVEEPEATTPAEPTPAPTEEPKVETNPTPVEEPTKVEEPTNIEPPSAPVQPVDIVKEALAIVDRFNREMVEWKEKYKTNIDIAWDYANSGRLLRVSSIDTNLYKPEANTARALERFEKGM
jgi:hypothetical protein